MAIRTITDLLPGATAIPVPIPHDCIDGFGAAYWRRPAAYLDPAVRAGISMLAKTDDAALHDGLATLARDIETGRWQANHADLLERDSMDIGYRLIVAEL